MMKDWECMTDLLLEDAGPREEPLEDKQVRSKKLPYHFAQGYFGSRNFITAF